jgi:hypothetical protein
MFCKDRLATKRAFPHAEYRSLVYYTRAFGLWTALVPDRVTHSTEPSVGFDYRL